MSSYDNIFDAVNSLFGNFDTHFRDMEKKLGAKNLLPSVTIPSVKSVKEYVQTYDDGEKLESYKNGRLHGEVIYHNGKTPTEYFIEGRLVTKSDWDTYRSNLEDTRKHYIYIDDREYVVTGKQLKEIKAKILEICKDK